METGRLIQATARFALFHLNCGRRPLKHFPHYYDKVTSPGEYMIKIVLFTIQIFLVSNIHAFAPKTFTIKNMVGFGAGPGIGEGSIYRTIRKRFESEKIGYQAIKKFKNEGNTSLQAGVNHVGMVYSSDFADFSLYLKREFAPDLFDDERYIVIDNFDIYVDAQKILKNLKDADLIEMTKHQYDAYAGIGFKRSYRYIYFADSFQDALSFNLNKLFFAFEMLQGNKYLEMKPYEIISKEDSLTAGVGARASVPLGGSAGLEFGKIVEFNRLSRLEVQAVGPEDRSFKNERLRISFEKEKGKSAMGYSALEIDFLNILQWTLFEHEFGYHYLDSYRINLGFKKEDVPKLKDENSPLGNAVRNVMLSGVGDLKTLKPYLVSEEHRKDERYTSRYSLLLRGKSKECKTSEIKITKDNKIKRFFRHTSENVKYKVNFVSKLFSNILKTFLRLDSFVLKKTDEFYSRNVCIEYESNENLMDGNEELFLDGESDKLSLKFEETYYVHNPKSEVGERCAKALKSCPGVNSDIIDDLEKGKYKSDMKININYILNKDAINYFNSRSLAEIYDAIHILCTKVKKRNKSNEIVKYDRTSKKCESALHESYDQYYKELISHKYSLETYKQCAGYARKHAKSEHGWAVLVEVCMHRSSLKEMNPLECSMPLWLFRNFAEKISKYTNKKEDMYAFFGFENIFFYGYLQGQTLEGYRKTCFKDGTFSGTGLIDNYMRREKLRPASLLILE